MITDFLGILTGTWKDIRLDLTFLLKYVQRHGFGSFRRVLASVSTTLRHGNALLHEGGMVVDTPSDAKSDSERLFARFMIQPDGDVVHLVSKEFLESPDIRQQHAAAVDNALSEVRERVQLLAATMTVGGTVVSLVASVGLVANQSVEWQILTVIVFPFAIALFRTALYQGLRFLLDRALARAFQ